MAIDKLIPKQSTMFDKIERWTEFVKNIGLIIGVPAILIIGIRLNDARVKALEAQIQLLQERSSIAAAEEVRAYRDLLNAQRERLFIRIDSLEKAGVSSDSILTSIGVGSIDSLKELMSKAIVVRQDEEATMFILEIPLEDGFRFKSRHPIDSVLSK